MLPATLKIGYHLRVCVYIYIYFFFFSAAKILILTTPKQFHQFSVRHDRIYSYKAVHVGRLIFLYSLQVSFSEIHLTPVSPNIIYMLNLLFLFQGKK